MTNDRNTALYLGMTNHFGAQDQPASCRRNSRVYRGLPLQKTGLLRTLHGCAECDCAGKAAEEMVAIEESGVDRNDESAVERYLSGNSRRIVRDVSVRAGLAYSLDMTKECLMGLAAPSAVSRAIKFVFVSCYSYLRARCSVFFSPSSLCWRP